MPELVRVAIFGTSWWADTMYLPPLAAHPGAEVVAVCGRREEPARALATEWNVPRWYTDPDELLTTLDGELDAVIIATANDSHHPLAMAAIERGLHVLCEKPLALSVEQGEEMTTAADARGVVTAVPFTYHYMPVMRWVRELVADGFVGRPLHLNARYYTSFGFDQGYSWRFDRDIAGSGIIGDLGAHWVHLGRWLLGDSETSVSATSANFVDRAPRPDGSAYEQVEDSVVMTVRYASGAYGVLHTSAVCWEAGPFEQSHHLELHGTEGTIYATCDWDTVQAVSGLRKGETERRDLPIPDHIWGDLRRDTVHDTYRDVFRTTDAMTRGWIDAIAAGASFTPDFAEGLAVQRVLDAAVRSAAADGVPEALDLST